MTMDAVALKRMLSGASIFGSTASSVPGGGSSPFGSGGHVPRNAACATVLTKILGHRRTACLEWACAMGMPVCLNLLDFRCFGVALGKEQAGRGKRLG